MLKYMSIIKNMLTFTLKILKHYTIMKKLFALMIATTMALSFFSCGNKTSELEARADSLQTALDQRNKDYQELDEFLTVISAGLDSISRQESELFNPSKESPAPNREQIKSDLEHFQQTLKEQRERIAELEKKLGSSTTMARKMKAIIISLKAQLTEKEHQLAKLQDEVASSNLTIQELTARMNTLAQRSANQSQVISSQNKMLETQDQIINEGYVMIGTKKMLKDAGVITKKFLGSTKVDYSNIDKRTFRSIDTRVVTEIEINSKSPDIMTKVPDDSYKMERRGDKTILHILDPSRFWSVSKFLIIKI